MAHILGIRKEDKNAWERRVPLSPSHVSSLIKNHALDIVVQSSDNRIFKDADYQSAGARVSDSLDDCGVIIGVKEIPVAKLQKRKTYLYFSHVIKGQEYNMPMLARLKELRCQLIDYERITDDKGRRLLFFGNYAGLAGMINSLWALGARLAHEGISNPFESVQQSYRYTSLEEAKQAVEVAADKIRNEGLPGSLSPFIAGFAGYGNVSQGAQEILDILPCEEIKPEDVESFVHSGRASANVVYKTVFHEHHMVEPRGDHSFELQDYYDRPDRYSPAFSRFLPYLSVLMNCIYWEEKYPRLVTLSDLKELFAGDQPPRLRVIGDITCDIGGAVECTVKATESDNPVFVYDLDEGKERDGVEGKGPVVLAVDNLPAELPREASEYFGTGLESYIPALVRANYETSYEQCELPPEIRRAQILHQGELTPDYRYLEENLKALPTREEQR